MIPQRVKLSGFLSYKDEQEIRFDGSPLWMLSGTNGSGKSSIFDAVTFALFGHHRGGSQNLTELINKESNNLSVEFDFTVEKQLYRIKRTVRRQKNDKTVSTQQVMKFVGGSSSWNPGVSPAASSEKNEQDGPALSDDTYWEAVPDTNYKTKFDAWVRETIGLDYESFTSSVLLLQGKSEKLLDSTPTGRAGVLARIVDLERYQKLHAKADDRRKELKGELEAISHQLAGIRAVTDEELIRAHQKIHTAEQARNQVQEHIDSLVSREQQARDWYAVQKKLSTARGKLAAAESVLATAVAIEKDYARLKELREVLPAIAGILTERGRIAESERKTEVLTRHRDEKTEHRRLSESALGLARTKLTDLKKTLLEAEGKQTRLNTRLRELAAILEKVKQVEEAAAEVKQLQKELQALPADPEPVVRQYQLEHDRLKALEQHIALLERLHQDRAELTKALAIQQQAQAEESRLKAEGLQAKQEFATREQQAKAAREDRAAKDQAAAEARALYQHAKQQAEEFQQLSGDKMCRVCGQPLTPHHFEAEKKRRDLAARAAERRFHDLADAAAKAHKLETELTQKEVADREHLAKLRDLWKDADAAVKQAAQDIKRLTDSCRQTYFALPDEFKEKIGPAEPTNWAKVAYPDRHDLTQLRKEAAQIDNVKRKLRQAQDEAKKVSELTAKLESAQERHARALSALSINNPGVLLQEFADKQAEEKAIGSAIAATKKAIAAAEAEVERYQRELNAIDHDLTEIAGKLNLEEASRKQSGEAIERARKALPNSWQKAIETAGMGERAQWQDEHDKLIAKGTENSYTQLQAARGGLESLRAEIAQLEAEAQAFPADARCDPDEVKAAITAARKELDQLNQHLLEVQADKRELDRLRTQREELGQRYKAIDAEYNRFKLLAELLGRDRLQRFLVRKAEKQIVDYANAVLDRLSGGQLFLKLVGSDEGSTEKALELECANRVTGGSAINVAFLSGSQRFRVAVALALGIGQYASKQHRPIESVIIDEGFGCLDRAGRQVMIQELQNLRGHLHCILLVSHQEEFAEAFPDGYRFELHDGATRVSRFVR
jgi:DNA repair exonuclease SbcCD ATPase subunit